MAQPGTVDYAIQLIEAQNARKTRQEAENEELKTKLAQQKRKYEQIIAETRRNLDEAYNKLCRQEKNAKQLLEQQKLRHEAAVKHLEDKKTKAVWKHKKARLEAEDELSLLKPQLEEAHKSQQETEKKLTKAERELANYTSLHRHNKLRNYQNDPSEAHRTGMAILYGKHQKELKAKQAELDQERRAHAQTRRELVLEKQAHDGVVHAALGFDE